MRRTALVTGGGRRLGAAFVKAFLDAGWDVAVHYHRSKAGAGARVAEARARGLRACALKGDLRRVADCRRVVREAARRLGRLDAVVNSAADFFPTPLPRVAERDWDRLMDLNLKGSFFTAQEASKVLRRGGAIVQVTDASKGWTRYAAYGISKAGAAALVRILRRALAPRVRVLEAAPGHLDFPEGARRFAATVVRRLG